MGNGNSVPIAPPYQGQNDQVPLVALKFPYCQRMQNFNNFYGNLNLRQGNKTFVLQFISATVPLNITGYEAIVPAFFLMISKAGNTKWYDISAAALTLVHTEVFTAGPEVYSLFFNNYLFYFGQGGLDASLGGTPINYTGAAWGVAGYTYPAGFNPFGGNVYKTRAYLIDEYSAAYVYSGSNLISGATFRVDLSSIVSSKSLLYIIRSISTTENQNPDSVQAFIFQNGEILVYAGSYPDDSSWGEVSHFKISNPLYHNSYVDAKGDSFIFTSSEILSLRNLFTSGYSQESETGIGSTIKNRWKQIIKGLGADFIYVKGIYDQLNDRIIISLPSFVDPDTGTTVIGKISQLIYDFTLSGWYEYVATGNTDTGHINHIVSAAYYLNNTYVFTSFTTTSSGGVCVIELEGNTNYLDQNVLTPGTNDSPIDFKLITAPLPIQKFGTNAITGVEVILKSDLYPQTNYQWIADLGRQISAVQPLTDQGSSVAKPMVNIGVNDAILAQLEISGSTVAAVLGLAIYALNVWYNTGEKGSR